MNQKYQYLIQKITECNDCRGTGIVAHPAWREYWFWTDHYRSGNYGRQPSKDTETLWWEETGFSFAALPPGEIDCPTCHGTGKLEEETDLKTALANLGVTTWER